ncbi:ribosomal-processing cysteine protease Prp [Ectobacillus antri]|jgi:uncharacterized protein YsxB (DUF464 family)|uniref:Ribosomal processing cysteine protease Prp n=1 Tax=Ectobacillus antri TaxID=2486280 RepID=A0ABT6H157_9BACI|nr:ribosomal-processing cysteine protease Prp [Ectobacillus antri]MDG4655376.1 ribosomal-processing cysteine protease Prp [Ectobacillus antri]MDG5753134.1 ribosomal-processing cysteine protease Prp [Ectobacillus antri]
MIKVTIHRTSLGIQSFEMTGHANFAEHGKDLVCAGVSAVVFGSINSIEALCHVQANINLGKNGGFLTYRLPELDNETFQKTQLLLEGMLVSLRTIEMDYGKYIRIKEIMQEV